MKNWKLGGLAALTLGLAACGVSTPSPDATQAVEQATSSGTLTTQRCYLDDCGDPNPPPSPPAPPTGANLRVTIKMLTVDVRDTEDVTGSGFLWLSKGVDEFYTIGGIAIAPETSNVGTRTDFSTSVIKTKSGNVYRPGTVVFDNVIAPNTRLVGEYTGFDQDMSRAVPVIAAIGSIGAVGVVATGCAATFFCGVGVAAVGALGAVLKLDSDDALGVGQFNAGVLRQNQISDFVYQSQLNACSGFQSSCDYRVSFEVKVRPTDAPLSPLY